jgi:serine phosphatase RsbU (regulator of sigma subunit)
MRLSTWSREAFGTILGIHLLACLFFPWTPRECLRPGVVLLVLNALVLATQIPRGRSNAGWALTEAAISPVLLAPGLLVCWWRYSRFRSNFRVLFESAAYRALQADMASARRIHESCLPAPRRDGSLCFHYAYEPMREIGGDLLFVPPMCGRDDGALSVVLLDVTGHGVAAALTVNRLVGELERIYGESSDAPPGDVLCALNRYVYLTLARHNVFVTALCIRADAERGVVQWASGGHPTAFLRRPDGRIEDLESTGMLLGAVDGAEYCPEQLELPFRPGDAVIAYTDGATEARDATGAALQTDGLRRLLAKVCDEAPAPADWPATLLRGVAGHHEGPTEDDMLVVSLYRPAAPAAAVPVQPATPEPGARRPAEAVGV